MLKLEDFKAKKIITTGQNVKGGQGGCVCWTKDIKSGETVDAIIDGVYSE